MLGRSLSLFLVDVPGLPQGLLGLEGMLLVVVPVRALGRFCHTVAVPFRTGRQTNVSRSAAGPSRVERRRSPLSASRASPRRRTRVLRCVRP